MARSDLRRRVLALLRKFAVPYYARKNLCWYDGHCISAGVRLPYWNVLHEAAHWVLAGEHRGVVNFGLGRDPDAHTPEDVYSPDTVCDYSEAEAGASGLGILFVASVNPFDCKHVLQDHCWDCTKEDERRVRRLAGRAARLGADVRECVPVVLGAIRSLRR